MVQLKRKGLLVMPPFCVYCPLSLLAVSGCYFRGDADGTCGRNVQENGPETGPGHKKRVRTAFMTVHQAGEGVAPCTDCTDCLVH